MSIKINRDAYAKLINEDVKWLLLQPRTLEREHIMDVLEHSVDRYYPPPSPDQPGQYTSLIEKLQLMHCPIGDDAWEEMLEIIKEHMGARDIGQQVDQSSDGKTRFDSAANPEKYNQAAPAKKQDDCREVFERWAPSMGYDITTQAEERPYWDVTACVAWEVWQAAWQSATKRESVDRDVIAEVIYGAEMHGSWCWEMQRNEGMKARPRKLADTLLEYFEIRPLSKIEVEKPHD